MSPSREEKDTGAEGGGEGPAGERRGWEVSEVREQTTDHRGLEALPGRALPSAAPPGSVCTTTCNCYSLSPGRLSSLILFGNVCSIATPFPFHEPLTLLSAGSSVPGRRDAHRDAGRDPPNPLGKRESPGRGREARSSCGRGAAARAAGRAPAGGRRTWEAEVASFLSLVGAEVQRTSRADRAKRGCPPGRSAPGLERQGRDATTLNGRSRR